MTEEEIRELPLNDEWVQCLGGMRIKPKEYVLKRKEEIRNCNHLFVKLKEGVYSGAFNSSDCYYDPCEVECVYCGLTNKHEYLENYLKRIPLGFSYKNETIESEMFKEVFKNAYRRSGKSFDETVFNLISNEVLNTYHPRLLYELANLLNPNASQEEIFETMRELKELETRQEELRLRNKEQASGLIKRYSENKKKVLVK